MSLYRLTRWFTRDWYEYLLQVGDWSRNRSKIGWPGWRKVWCRLEDHKCGVWWTNPGGYEPDMHCKNCGDDLS